MNVNRKLNKNLLLILGVVIAWVIVFVSMTPMIIKIADKNIKASDLDLSKTNGKVVYSIDSLSKSENVFNEVRVSGWAFVENDSESPNKELFFVFVSDKNSYMVEMNTFNRWDLKNALKDLDVPLDRTGFQGSFSPLLMRNGIYQLYIFDRESESLLGVLNTNRNFLKNNRTFEELTDN